MPDSPTRKFRNNTGECERVTPTRQLFYINVDIQADIMNLSIDLSMNKEEYLERRCGSAFFL